ncbi:hypothetical protein [Nonomuraea sp. NPDC050783]|uniref:hypothetical protein n=1 Tax=Nonomuraea sp. NPDC050783 TaxID=3154634 RepID=UPI0034658854
MNRWGSAVVGHAGLARPEDLLRDLPGDLHGDLHGGPPGRVPLGDVFTVAERVRSARGRTLQHWAGRLAGKRAVLRLLGLPATPGRLGLVEVLPRPTRACRGDAACLDGHPPAVRLTGELAGLAGAGEHIRLSLSHTAAHALAVALHAPPTPRPAGPAPAEAAALPVLGPKPSSPEGGSGREGVVLPPVMLFESRGGR